MSRYFYDKSESESIKLLCEERREAAAMIAPLRRTLKKFGGKVYNKRFLDALREEAGYKAIYDDRRGDRIFIEACAAHRYERHCICMIMIPENRRINAAEAAQDADTRYTKLLKEAAEIEEAAARVDEVKRQLADLDRLKNSILKGVPYEVRDIYNIR